MLDEQQLQKLEEFMNYCYNNFKNGLKVSEFLNKTCFEIVVENKKFIRLTSEVFENITTQFIVVQNEDFEIEIYSSESDEGFYSIEYSYQTIGKVNNFISVIY